MVFITSNLKSGAKVTNADSDADFCIETASLHIIMQIQSFASLDQNFIQEDRFDLRRGQSTSENTTSISPLI